MEVWENAQHIGSSLLTVFFRAHSDVSASRDLPRLGDDAEHWPRAALKTPDVQSMGWIRHLLRSPRKPAALRSGVIYPITGFP
ncbi:hypothetical protein MPNT_100011 [Candidatus Methylacidithermus pantelleriae]|uniref:Uncharacterized protein n=1 Tax=Candidatus Methylacidithermus pantelleriae TaxID=2744239 RepID=A0A8J2FV74_9BACT|nr:hypothetical protein MPNT_100011 [Candidatus Methylacidithermus pantelleriae]